MAVADTEARDLTEKTALVPTDHLLVQDNGTSDLQRIDTLNAKPYFADFELNSAANTRFDLPTNASRQWGVFCGPYHDMAVNTVGVGPGALLLGLSYVRGGLYEDLYIDIEVAGAAGDDLYMVTYNLGADGMPTTLEDSFGPWDIDTNVNALGLTAQSVTVVPGLRWCGAFAPTANTGTPTIEGGRSGLLIGNGSNTGIQMRQHLLSGDTASATPPADVSSYTLGSSTSATKFTGQANGFPLLMGKEIV